MTRPDAEHWSRLTIALHWLTVALIVAIAAIGLYMTDMPNSMAKLKTYALHKSLGLTVLALTLIRLAWRLRAGTPRQVPNTPPWQRRAATVSHALLYLLLLVVPLSGWAYNSAANFALQWFGLINLPRLLPADAELKTVMLIMHNGAFWALMALVMLHTGAALWHHAHRRDPTLCRMLPILPHPERSDSANPT